MSLSNLTNNQFSLSVDGLTELNTDILTVNGQSITGNYLNSNSNTVNVNTVITLNLGSTQFTVKDTSNNELIKCDNATDITSFYRPQTSFTGQNTGNDIVNLTYGASAYWLLSGSSNISGVFTMASAGAIWFKNSIGTTLLLMSGSGVQVNNPTLTGQTNLYTVFIASGGGNQLLMMDSAGNIQNAFTLNYTYGDPNATIYTVVPSNISAQQQTLQWTRDFTVNGLYGWKLSTTTINKNPLVSDLPITINNLYSSAMYPTTLFINGINTVTEIASNKIKCSSGNLLNLTNNIIEFKVDSDKFKFFDILDIRAYIAAPFRIQYNVLSGYAHSFSVNNTQLFSLSSVASIPTITSNGYFTITDNVNNKVYTDASGIYTRSIGNAYSLMTASGSAFMTSSTNSVLNLSDNGTTTLNASNGGQLTLNAGASLYSKTNFVCSLGVNNINIISVYDEQNGNDTLFFSRNINDPNILFGTDITQNSVIGQASQGGAFSSDATTGDLIIRNNQKNIRLGTDGSGLSNFIINSNGSSSFVSRAFNTHQVIIRGQEFYANNNSSTEGISINIGVNRNIGDNRQLWLMNTDLPLNDTNTCIRLMPSIGSIDVISTNGNFFRGLQVAGSTFTTNNTTTIKGTASDRLSSLIVDTLRAGISLKSNLTGAVNWNFWSGGSTEAFNSAWYLYNETNANFRFTVQAGGNIYLNAYTTNGTLSVTGGNGLISSSSDIRLKENINYITDTKKALQQILQLKPCEFNFIANKEHTQLGLIAQDVEKIIPISVDGKKYEYQAKRDFENKLVYDEKGEVEYELDENGNKKIRARGLDYNAITATQILGIQELNKRLENQEVLLQNQQNVINNQKNEINDYKDKVNHLLITQDNLTKQIIDITNNLNKITEKLISITNK